MVDFPDPPQAAPFPAALPQSLTPSEIADLLRDCAKLKKRGEVADQLVAALRRKIHAHVALFADVNEHLESDAKDLTDEDVAVLIGRIVEAIDAAGEVTIAGTPFQ